MRNVFARLTGKPVVKKIPLVVLEGTIRAGGAQRSLNWRNVSPMLEKAFERTDTNVVALLVNSPGGSPAQSSAIYTAIRRLKHKHNKRVVAFVQDAAASGGYYIACAACQIVVDPNSVVGSIGVVSQWFGVRELMGKIGVTPRTYTAGTSKSFLSPFEEEPSEEDLARLKRLQEQIHATFRSVVQESRGSKLATDVDLFDGNFWIGQEAVDLGLADEVGDPMTWLEDGHKFDLIKGGGSLLERLTSRSEMTMERLMESAVQNNSYGLKM